MLATSLRVSLLGSAAFLLAACAGASTAPGSAGLPVASLDAAQTHAIGKLPQHFVTGVTAARRGKQVSCTTVTPSADVISALEEPGSTATAATVITQSGGQYGKIDFDGSECDIAVYVAPSASGTYIHDSSIHDGIRAGLVVDGASNVEISGNGMFNVGDHNGSQYAPDGVQYGFDLMIVNKGKGEVVTGNSFYNYQKEGMLAFDNVHLSLTSNVATGAGPIGYIASNGFELDAVALKTLKANQSTLNQYTGPYYGAAGYLFCGDQIGGKKFSKAAFTSGHNVARENDINVYIAGNQNCS